MRSLTAILVFLAIPLCLNTALKAEVVDRIVAIVGDEIITLSDVKRVEGRGKKEALNSLIREKLFQSEIERLEIKVTEDEMARAIQEVLYRNRITVDELKRELQGKGMTYDAYKVDLAREIQKMKFLGQVIYPRIKISEDEVNRRLGPNPTEEERLRVRNQIVESRLSQELDNYLDEARQKTHLELRE
jgi:peptidyl-prolyl cis-trans isomerase SurA